MRPPSSHKAASVPIKPGKMPFIVDRSNKVPAKPAPARMASALPAPSRKTPDAQERDMLERKTEGKHEPVLLLGEQNTNVIDVRAQTMSLHLPFANTMKQSKELSISKTQEVTLEALKGREKDRAHKMEEETIVTVPHLKSKETEIQKIWVSTKEIAVEDPYTEDNRPFSAERLAHAKMMIVANSKHQHLKPATMTLPSSFSTTSKVSTMSMSASLSFNTSPLTFLEDTPVVVIEQSGSRIKVNQERTQHQMERNLPEDLPRTSQEPTSELPDVRVCL